MAVILHAHPENNQKVTNILSVSIDCLERPSPK